MKKIVKPNKLVLDKMIISKLDEKFLVKVLGGSKGCVESIGNPESPLCHASDNC